MLTNNQIDQIFFHSSFNSRLLLKELNRRGIGLSKIGRTDVIRASFKKHDEIFYDLYNNLNSYPAGLMIDDKFYSKQYLKKHGFSVVEGDVFTEDKIDDALKYAEKIGFPLVLKPTSGSQGEFVFLDINNKKDLREKIDTLVKSNSGNGFFLVEKQFEGNEYRLFITRDNFFAAVLRTPANVTGDGRHNLKSLIDKENYRRMNPRNTCLCIISIDQVVHQYLSKKNLNLDYVPKKGEQIFLRRNSNVSTGGNCYDVTDLVHPAIKKLAKKLLTIWPNVPFIGIDFMCEDISKPLENYSICELNSAPGLSLHIMPEKGKSRDVASAIVDIAFPETKK